MVASGGLLPRARSIELRLGCEVRRLDAPAPEISLADGTGLRYDACLVATGGSPKRLLRAG